MTLFFYKNKQARWYYSTHHETQILDEINNIKPKIKELSKYDKYCKEIIKRTEGIQYNLNNFDKDIQKEKDNSRSL